MRLIVAAMFLVEVGENTKFGGPICSSTSLSSDLCFGFGRILYLGQWDG